MRIGQHVPITASFSITQKSEIVKIIDIHDNGDYYKIQYANGYTEMLPLAAFIV